MTAADPNAPRAPLPAAVPPCLVAELDVLAARWHAAMAGAGLANAPDTAAAATLAVFAKSPFVAEFAIRRPADFAALVADSAPRSRADHDREVAAALAGAADQAAAKSALRRLRQAAMTRIAWRDIHRGVAVDTIMHELSDFADAVVAGAVAWL
ncbi:MAG: hypothetical protein RLW62_11965, partial [Gammaproteobacteria bacterium]